MTPPIWWISVTPENVDELSNAEIDIVLDSERAKNRKEIAHDFSQESKEKLEKSLEFENDTFKINSKWWEEVTDKDKGDPILGKFVWKKPKVKANATGDVVEYLEGDAKWEQIFITYGAFIREVCKAKKCSKEDAEKKYLMTIDELKEKMKDKPNGSEEYKKFFNEEVNAHLAGYWSPNNETFYDVERRLSIWLVGGANASFDQVRWEQADGNRYFGGMVFGFSGYLLKN